MDLAHDYSADKYRTEAFGGASGLQRIKQYAETIKAQSCPFCGHSASLILQSEYGAPAVAVECSYCHCRTTTSGPSYDYLSGKFADIYEAIQSVAGRWNCRKDGLA